MATNFEKVLEFHKVFECLINANPTLFGDENFLKLRVDLIDEEFRELKEAITNRDLVSIADALTDILYVTYGFGVSLGINLDAAFHEVHRSNMTKLDSNGQVIRRYDGKVLKGPNYTPPDLKTILEKQGPIS